jgi:hypothetical protein
MVIRFCKSVKRFKSYEILKIVKFYYQYMSLKKLIKYLNLPKTPAIGIADRFPTYLINSFKAIPGWHWESITTISRLWRGNKFGFLFTISNANLAPENNETKLL